MMYILAEYTNKGYKPTRMNENFEHLCDVEYGDIVGGEIQIWEYPSGRVYAVIPNKQVEAKHYYSLPGSGLWHPQLKFLSKDEELVNNAYETLNK